MVWPSAEGKHECEDDQAEKGDDFDATEPKFNLCICSDAYMIDEHDADNENSNLIARMDERMDNMEDDVKYIRNTLDAAFGPKGFCNEERNKTNTLSTHVKGLWGVISFIVATLVTMIVEMTRRL